MSERLYVLTATEGGEFAVSRLPSGELVFDVDGRRLVRVTGPLSYFRLGETFVAAGTHDTADHVVIDDGGLSAVRNGVWVSFPQPYTPGMRVRVVWRDRDGQVIEDFHSPPLTPDWLQPRDERGTTYAYIEEDS